MFIELLSACIIGSYGGSLSCNSKRSIKCISLNNGPCQARSTLVDINSYETLFSRLLSDLMSVIKVAALLMIHILQFELEIK